MKSPSTHVLAAAEPARPAACARLLRVARPGLEAGDAGRLAAALTGSFRSNELRSLLIAGDPRARAVAALGLGLTGVGAATEAALARALHDADAGVSAAAEHALWSVWLRGNGGAGVAAFEAGLAALTAGRRAAATDAFEEAARVDAGFAEAHHQLAVARTLAGEAVAAEAAFDEALRCNPRHFAALAGAGHAAVERDDFAAAEGFYRRALGIHPTLDGVGAALDAVAEVLAHRRRRAAG